MLRSKAFLSVAVSLLFGSLYPATGQQPRAEIDVFIVFDKNAAGEIRGAMPEWGQRAINNLQQAMVRSKLGDQIHFNLAGVGTLDGYETAILQYQKEILRRNPNVTQEVVDAVSDGQLQMKGAMEDWLNIINGNIPGLLETRNQRHADLVLLAQYFATPVLYGVGHGYTLSSEAKWNAQNQQNALHKPYFSEKNFVGCFYYNALVNPVAGTDVFVHEVMHLFGCGHSDRQTVGGGPFYYPDSSGFNTADFRYGTIMSYPERNVHVQHPSVPHVNGNSYTLTCLSGDYSPRLSGADVNQPGLPERVGDELHNNRMVALRNATLISSYRMSGNEKALNANPEAAIPLPPMQDSKRWAFSIGASESEVPQGTALLEKSIPGLTRENVLTTLVFGNNKPAPVSAGERIAGGSGKSLWYKLTPPAAGALRIGIRRCGTDADFSPVMAVRRADNAPCTPTPLPDADATGYLRVVELQAEAGKELLIQVDSGNAAGGQFSMVAQLSPSAEPQHAPAETQETEGTPAEPQETEGTPPDTTNNDAGDNAPAPPHDNAAGNETESNANSGNAWSAVDTLLLLIALFSSTSTLILFIKTLKGSPSDPQRTPWTPAPGAGAAPQQQAATQRTQISGKHLLLRGTLYNGTHKEYTYPISQLMAEGNIILGYDDSCGICIADDTISGNHALIALTPHKSEITIMDVGSTNGTRVGGRRITPGERVTLYENDQIQLGLAKFTISIR